MHERLNEIHRIAPYDGPHMYNGVFLLIFLGGEGKGG